MSGKLIVFEGRMALQSHPAHMMCRLAGIPALLTRRSTFPGMGNPFAKSRPIFICRGSGKPAGGCEQLTRPPRCMRWTALPSYRQDWGAFMSGAG